MRLTFIALLFPVLSFSQDYNWWNNKHNWDLVTPWYEYIIMSPAYMGPNALPVPDEQNGKFDTLYNFELSGVNHFNPGDQTQNIYSKLIIPIVSKKVGISLSGVPFELYKNDTITRDKRISRDYDSNGYSIGDLFITTYIQLLRDHPKFPDFLISVNLKTASGNNLEAARFTDSPGYYFDLSSGKTFYFKNKILKSIRPYYLLGFYSWQTNQRYRQNDAFMFGAGCDLELNKIKLSNYFGGYSGYINNGDKPLVNRFTLITKFNSGFNYKIMIQQGFSDYEYFSLKFGLIYTFKK